jgi:hypothetical protein
MAKKILSGNTEFKTDLERKDTMIVDGFEVEHGDLIKVAGQYGLRFKFDYLVTNTKTGSQWVDCFEVYRGQVGCYRSFKLDSVKRIPKKKKRSKRVS